MFGKIRNLQHNPATLFQPQKPTTWVLEVKLLTKSSTPCKFLKSKDSCNSESENQRQLQTHATNMAKQMLKLFIYSISFL